MRSLLVSFLLVISSVVSAAMPQIYFSPQDHLSDRLISLINAEQKSIETAIYCFTHREIAKALIAAKKRGVEVEVIVDPFSVKIKAPLASLVKAGIPVYVFSPPEVVTNGGKVLRTPLMHDKFCVFGDGKVWTGSFNFTYEASRSNAENAVVLDASEAVDSYREHFFKLKESSCISYDDYLSLKKQEKTK
jgi:phosphatidylserine/phosphatidylglycerophosphate/cardiolipin synthase-like enzyme